MSDRSKTKTAEERFAITLTERSLPKVEEALIRKILEETKWNLKQSASLLNIARGTLYSKIGKYNIRRLG
ncbi:helix-turn-helix domain-containing protein [Desulfobacula sp.]|uniref:helix-turn-helix domain-containing protein n=1 Tax=Desulfobacula sp. TaxID=2593537 RepID=UPI00263696E2|nr:helix-turn-helix domain-containing protein [Desulfobacula sp.]